MPYSRRNFLGTALAAAGSMVLTSGTKHVQRNKKPFDLFFAPGNLEDDEVLAKARLDIPRVRTRETSLTLLKADGQPLSNVDVEVKQLGHQFLFGDNNWFMSQTFRSGLGESDRLKYYRDRFSELFNSLNVTTYWTERPRNDSAKTEDFQGFKQMEDVEESVNWALSRGLVPKGHPIFWTVPKALPEWLKEYPYETMEKFIEVRVRSLTARYKGRIKHWDAVNEMLWEPHPANISKRQWPYLETMDNMVDYIGKVLNWARSEDSEAKYTINDYGLSTTLQENLISHDVRLVTASSQRKRYLELVRKLQEKGTAPDLLGLQCHTGWLKPSEQMAFYDEMATTGIPLSITEFWAKTSEIMDVSGKKIESEEWRISSGKKRNEGLSLEEAIEIRDKYILDYLTCAFAHPAVDSFYFWGFLSMVVNFSDKLSASHDPEPVFQKVHDLINKEWNTNLILRTDNNGFVRFRGYCGDYSVRVKNAFGIPTGYGFNIEKNRVNNEYVIRTSV
jgi:GH35 family endo-1,4-beta-xylanase